MAQGGQQGQEQHVPYARFKEINDKLKEAERRLADATKAQQARQQEEQSLAERLKQLEDSLASERAASLRLKVATEKKLPAELAERLRGETAEDLAADADRLLALIKPAAPGVPPPGGGIVKKLDLSTMTPAEIRKARAEGKLK